VSLKARVAAKGFIAQIDALGRADAAGDRAEAIVSEAWSRLLRLIDRVARTGDVAAFRDAVGRLFGPLGVQIAKTIAQSVEQSAERAYQQAADTVTDLLPLPAVKSSLGESRLAEREIPRTQLPGFINIDPSGPMDVGSVLRLDNADGLTDDAARDLFRQLIFPPPDRKTIRAVVYQSDWIARLQTQTSLAGPDEIARAVVKNLADGGKVRDLARSLLPVVNGVRATARRIARDETMHATHAMQHQAWAQVGEMVVGFQVHAVLDDRTRPEHRARNGQTFYKQPTGNQRGMDECPQPPRESPKDGSKWAYGCRCFTSPLLLVNDRQGNNLTPPAQIDPKITGDWFADTTERNRKMAVGVERYQIVSRSLGRDPRWSDFTDAGGQLLPLDALRSRVRD